MLQIKIRRSEKVCGLILINTVRRSRVSKKEHVMGRQGFHKVVEEEEEEREKYEEMKDRRW